MKRSKRGRAEAGFAAAARSPYWREGDARVVLQEWSSSGLELEDGRVGLDNNLCELHIRSLAVGRKNYLHAGWDAGAERAAALYTVLRTCALNGVDAYTYVKDVLDKLAAGWPQQRIEELLPDAWAASRAATQAKAQLDDPTA